jgi:hypothetical protein
MTIPPDPVFEIANDTRFGVEEAIRWTADHLSDVRRWLDDRSIQAPSELLHAYELLHHGLADESAVLIPVRLHPVDDTDAIRKQLTDDLSGHPNARIMVEARAPLRLVRLGVLLCPVYVDEHRELLLPTWLRDEATAMLFPPNDHFTLGRTSSTVWLVLEAPVVRDVEKPFAKFANFFIHQGTTAGATWRWRGIEDPTTGDPLHPTKGGV